MSLAVPEPGQTGLAPWEPGQYETGLEEFNVQESGVMPRVKIVHKEGMFEENLTGTKFPAMQVIILGLLKQRTKWNADVLDDPSKDVPECRSNDALTGEPRLFEPRVFPWAESNFSFEQYVKQDGPPGEDGAPTWQAKLPCGSCKFGQWGKEGQKSIKPSCNIVYVLPILYRGIDVNGHVLSDELSPAMLSLKSTGIKPSNAYMTPFATSNTPLFTVYTTIGLNRLTRGTTDYAVPTFLKGPGTDQGMWGEYNQQFIGVKTMVRGEKMMVDDPIVIQGNDTGIEPAPGVPPNPLYPDQDPPNTFPPVPLAQPVEQPGQYPRTQPVDPGAPRRDPQETRPAHFEQPQTVTSTAAPTAPPAPAAPVITAPPAPAVPTPTAPSSGPTDDPWSTGPEGNTPPSSPAAAPVATPPPFTPPAPAAPVAPPVATPPAPAAPVATAPPAPASPPAPAGPPAPLSPSPVATQDTSDLPF